MTYERIDWEALVYRDIEGGRAGAEELASTPVEATTSRRRQSDGGQGREAEMNGERRRRRGRWMSGREGKTDGTMDGRRMEEMEMSDEDEVEMQAGTAAGSDSGCSGPVLPAVAATIWHAHEWRE
jgi:hypothetical protein